jgi:hypothetical protein
MTFSDDEVVARLRASFQATAVRTPIGVDRLSELTSLASVRRVRPLVVTMSAAAAVVAVAVGAVVLTDLSSDRQSTPASGGPSDGASCTPENYYVIASKEQLSGLTYLLAPTPAGYQLVGAWGTISRNKCPDSATWYVEYGVGTAHKEKNVDLEITRMRAWNPNGAALRDELAASDEPNAPTFRQSMTAASAGVPSKNPDRPSATPSPPASISVSGHSGTFFGDSSRGSVVWSADGNLFQLSGPITDGRPDLLLAIAETLTAVAPDDARIVPPPGCAGISAGHTCR